MLDGRSWYFHTISSKEPSSTQKDKTTELDHAKSHRIIVN